MYKNSLKIAQVGASSQQLTVVTLRRWPYCPNKNVFSERLNCPYDSPGCRKSGGRPFQWRGSKCCVAEGAL